MAINLDTGCEESEGKRGGKREEEGRGEGRDAKGERKGGKELRRNGSESWGRGEGREDEEEYRKRVEREGERSVNEERKGVEGTHCRKSKPGEASAKAQENCKSLNK